MQTGGKAQTGCTRSHKNDRKVSYSSCLSIYQVMPVGGRGRRSEQEALCTQHVKILFVLKKSEEGRDAAPSIPPSLVSAGLRRDAPWSPLPPPPPKPPPSIARMFSHLVFGFGLCRVVCLRGVSVAYLTRTVSGRLIGALEVEARRHSHKPVNVNPRDICQ